jgi:hypothetical protein
MSGRRSQYQYQQTGILGSVWSIDVTHYPTFPLLVICVSGNCGVRGLLSLDVIDTFDTHFLLGLYALYSPLPLPLLSFLSKVSRLDFSKGWLIERSLDLVHTCLNNCAHGQSPVLRDTCLLIARVPEPLSLEMSVVDRNVHVSAFYRQIVRSSRDAKDSRKPSE